LKLHRLVQKGQFLPFSQECQRFYSQETIDMVTGMLQPNPSKRITMKTAFKSKWMWKDYSKKVDYISPKKML